MTDDGNRERRSHFRGRARPGRRVDVEFTIDGESPPQTHTTVTRNIGVGGAFVLTESPLPIGTTLHLSIRIPTADEPVEINGEVRWVESDGMGIRFAALEPDPLLRLNEYFATLTGTDPTD